MSLNKKDFVLLVSNKTGVLEEDVDLILTAFLDQMKEELLEDNKLVFENFIGLELKERAARNGFNPKTKKPMHIPAKKIIKIDVSKKMNEILKNI